MEDIIGSTCKMMASQAVPNFDWDECVDWAIGMLRLNYETPSILILAGLTKPVYYSETVGYLKSALAELGLEQKTGDEGAILFCSFAVRQIAQSVNIKNNLAILRSYSLQLGNPKFLSDFYLLYYAWNELGHAEHQSYWEGADKSNIESIVTATAAKWLVDYKNYYENILANIQT